MAAVKEKMGQMPCLCCGHPVMVRKTETGTLTAACDGCDVSMFAKGGTDAFRRWLAAIVPLPGAAPKEPYQEPAGKAPEPAPAAPPPAPAKAQPFDPLGFLTKGSK